MMVGVTKDLELLKMLFSGIMFGIWPLLMNRSGLDGNYSTVAILIIAACMLMPTAFFHLPQQEFLLWVLFSVIILAMGVLAYKLIPIIPIAHNTQPIVWWLVVLAAVMSTTGLIAFNSALGHIPPVKIPHYLLIMILIQVAVPIVYYVIKTGRVTLRDAIGFIATAIAVVALKPR
jgi:hypothetical protein